MVTKEFERTQRIGDQIQRELAELIARHVNDPRVGAATVSGVRVSKDLAHATVYVTPHEDADVEQTLRGLNHASGFLRRKLGSRIRLRQLPKLRFTYDSTLDDASRVMRLLDEARRRTQGDDGE